MKKNLYLVIMAISVFCNSYSQEDKKNKSLHINSSIGFATLEVENLSKINAVSKELFVGIDLFNIKEDMSIYSGIEYSDISGDFSNNNAQTYVSNKYLSLPILLRYKKLSGNNLNFYIDAGIYGSYLFKSDVEILNQSDSENGIGFNLGFLANIGALYKFDDIWSFNVGIRSKADFSNNAKDDLPEYKISNLYSINIGFIISL